jgi:hypothetical protein
MPLDLFSKTKIPDEIPENFISVINQLSYCQNQTDCLNLAYEVLSQKFHGEHIKTCTRFWKIWQSDIGKLWDEIGFMHCTNINYLLRFILVKSKWFKDEDIKLRWTLYLYFLPHQYAVVQVNSRKIPVDIWAKTLGIKLGDYAHQLHTKTKL